MTERHHDPWVVTRHGVGRLIEHVDPADATSVEYDEVFTVLWAMRLLRLTSAVTAMVVLIVVIALATGKP